MLKAVLAALALTLFYNLFFFKTDLGLGFGVIFLAVNLLFFLQKDKNSKNKNLGVLFSLVSTLFAFLFAFRANEIVQVLNLYVATQLSLLSLYFYKLPTNFSYQFPTFILSIIKIPYQFLKSLISLAEPETYSSQNFPKNTVQALLRGLALTIPIIIILIFLFSSADPVFEKISSDFFKNIWERSILSLLIFTVSLGLGLIKFTGKLDQFKESLVSSKKEYELTLVLVSVGLLLLLFISVQFKYLFSNLGERELHQLGIKSLTYSEYVRRGFFELLIASSIVTGVIIYALEVIHKLINKQKLLIQSISSVLIVEIGLLLLSAAQRVNLYQLEHGLTRARVFGFIFLLWLGLVLVILLVKVFKDIKKEWFFTSQLLTFFSFLLLTNLINIDGIIATKYKPTVNKEIDYFYLTSLSSDGYESWVLAIENASRQLENIRKNKEFSSEDSRKLFWEQGTLTRLNKKVNYLQEKYEPSKQKWQSLNLSEYLAYQYTVKNKKIFEKLPELLDEVNSLYSSLNPQIRDLTPIDRDISPPLVR